MHILEKYLRSMQNLQIRENTIRVDAIGITIITSIVHLINTVMALREKDVGHPINTEMVLQGMNVGHLINTEMALQGKGVGHLINTDMQVEVYRVVPLVKN